MGISLHDGRWRLEKRVPKRFQHVDQRRAVYIALGTDSKAEAEKRRPQVEAELMAYWEALADGRSDDAQARYDAARKIAHTQGFTYAHWPDIATGPIQDLIARLDALGSDADMDPAVVDAIAGAVPPPKLPTLSAALGDYFDLTRDRLDGKSDGQIKRWRLPRERCVRNFIEAVEDKPMDQITRNDALTYRSWWRDRVENHGHKTATANKDISNLSDVFGTWSDLRGHELVNPFRGVRFRQSAETDSHPFSTKWISENLLASGALDRLNAQAREPFLIMVNTGARPSEIIDAALDDFALDDPIPHLKIRARPGRALKTAQSKREIPLVGVSLDAARRFVDIGLCPRYQTKGAQWSAAVNKYLTENGLRETPAHTAYSLRHSFEDRLQATGSDDRLRAELMGHKYDRPAYGLGGGLDMKLEAVKRIAF